MLKDAVTKMRREAPASVPHNLPPAHIRVELWERRRRCWEKLGTVRAGPEKPYPAVTQPLWSTLGSQRGQNTVGWGPLRGSGSSSLEGSKKGLLQGRNALDVTVPPKPLTIFSHMGVAGNSTEG